MDLTRTVIDQLNRLVHDLDGGPDTAPELLDQLVVSLNAAVASFSGLSLTVSQGGNPVTVRAFGPPEDAAPVTSLRWTPAPRPGTDPAELVLYAGAAGAFVDLAADLTYVLSRRSGPPVAPDVRLDLDLPPPSRASGLTGLDELALLNRACGVLLERGAEPGEVTAILVRQAEAAGLDRYGYARVLLESVSAAGSGPA